MLAAKRGVLADGAVRSLEGRRENRFGAERLDDLAPLLVDVGRHHEFHLVALRRPDQGVGDTGIPRGRIEDQVVSFTERFHVVLYHQAAADRLDVDGHPLAVRRGREAGSDVRWRTALIFRLGQIEAPGWNIDLLDRCVDDGGEAGIDDLVGGHLLVSLFCASLTCSRRHGLVR